MSDQLKVGDYVAHVHPDFFHHFCGKIIAVEQFQGRLIAVVTRLDGTRTTTYRSLLRKLETLDYFILGIEDPHSRPG